MFSILESAKYLPLCIQGRLRHGFHFTLKSILKEAAVTFVVARVAGTLVTQDRPFAAQGDWLQVRTPHHVGPHVGSLVTSVGDP